MPDQDEESAFGANAVDPGYGIDDEDDSSDDGRVEIKMEPKFRRCTREEAMGIDNDEDSDED